MTSAILALLLAAAAGTQEGDPQQAPVVDPSQRPPPDPEQIAPPVPPAVVVARPTRTADVAEQERSTLHVREFRSGVGLAQVVNGLGVSPAATFGVELSPWERVGFRIGAGLIYGGSFGELSSVEVNPEVVYRLGPPTTRLLPYLGAGVNLALITIDPQGPRATPIGNTAAKLTATPRSTRAVVADGPPPAVPGSGPGAVSGPAEFTASPELAAGAAFRVANNAALDVGARYLAVPWRGGIRHAFAETVAVCVGF